MGCRDPNPRQQLPVFSAHLVYEGGGILSLTQPIISKRLQPIKVTLRGEINDLLDGAFRDIKDGSLAVVGEGKDRCRNAVLFARLQLVLCPRHVAGEKPSHPLAGANG